MQPELGETLRDQQKAATREAIMQATLSLLAEKGYEKLTVSDIAKQAGVARGLINYHFDGKDDLVEQAEQRMLEMLIAGIRNSITREQVPARDTVDFLDAVWAELTSAKTILPVFMTLATKAVSDEVYRQRFLKHLLIHRTMVIETLEEIAGPLIRQANFDLVAAGTAIVAMVTGLTVVHHINPNSDESTRALNLFKEVVLDAITLRINATDD